MSWWVALASAQVCSSPVFVGSLPAEGVEVSHALVPVVAWRSECPLRARWTLRDDEGVVADGESEARHGRGTAVAELTGLPWLPEGRYELAVEADGVEQVVRFRVGHEDPMEPQVWGSADEGWTLWTSPGAVVVLRDEAGHRLDVGFADAEGALRVGDPGGCFTARAQGSDGQRGATWSSCEASWGECGVGCDSTGVGAGAGLALVGWLAVAGRRRLRGPGERTSPGTCDTRHAALRAAHDGSVPR